MKRFFNTYGFLTLLLTAGLAVWAVALFGQAYKKVGKFEPGKVWPDTNGNHINAHGGGILEHNGNYYWFGEYRSAGRDGYTSLVGVSCYQSKDLMNWESKGIALKVSDDPKSDIAKGCMIERPKVVYNDKTQQFVMWFHLELKGQSYNAARTAVAVSKNVEGPYRFVASYRPHAGVWPMGYTGDRTAANEVDNYKWWSAEWYKAVDEGLFVKRDFEQGQMSRDMTLFKDDDGRAFQICASEENLTLHISELTSDYTGFTDRWTRAFPAGHNEAPAVFKYKGKYYMITSGCTGWDANAARLAVADSMLGEWKQLGNPCVGEHADKTFFAQSTFVLPLNNNRFIFMADRWTPKDLSDARYIWLPITFENDVPKLYWSEAWDFKSLEK